MFTFNKQHKSQTNELVLFTPSINQLDVSDKVTGDEANIEAENPAQKLAQLYQTQHQQNEKSYPTSIVFNDLMVTSNSNIEMVKKTDGGFTCGNLICVIGQSDRYSKTNKKKQTFQKINKNN